jgi:prepilin-type N-terminal cleavage/methylation domain-containing protein
MKTHSRGITLVEMLIVVTIIGLIAGISFPAVSSGLDSLRLRSASDSLVSFLNAALNRAERRQEVAEIAISTQDSALHLTTPTLSRELDMPPGVTIRAVWPKLPDGETNEPRRFLLFPGGNVPRIGIEIANRKGVRRLVRVNPMTGVPEVQPLEAFQEAGQ